MMSETFFNRSAQETLDELHTSPLGLSTAEAESRTKTFGPNKLSEGKKKSIAVVFLEQFKDLLLSLIHISTDSGTWTAIWSPSKSALYAVQAKGWSLMARPSTRIGSKAWIPSLWSVGARFKSTGCCLLYTSRCV